MAKMDFSQSGSKKMINQVMKKVDETELDNMKINVDMDLIDMNEDNEWIFGLQEIDFFAENIKEDGFSGVIEVYAKNDGRYEINSGHRRFLAAKKVGMKTIPCLVKKYADDKTRANNLIKKNILNRDMTPLRWGRAMLYYKEKVLFDFKGDKRKQLSKVFNMSETKVHRYMALTDLIPEFEKEADKPAFPYYNLYPIAQLEPELQKKLYEKLISDLKQLNTNEEDTNLGLEAYSKRAIEQQINLLLVKEKEKQERDDLDIPKDQDNNGFELVMDKRNKKIVTESIPIKSNTEDTKIEDIDSDKEINIPVKKVVQIEQPKSEKPEDFFEEFEALEKDTEKSKKQKEDNLKNQMDNFVIQMEILLKEFDEVADEKTKYVYRKKMENLIRILK